MVGCCLQRAQSRDLGQLGSSGEVLEVITEVDAWDKARSALESGLTPQQVMLHTSTCPPAQILLLPELLNSKLLCVRGHQLSEIFWGED